MGVKQALKRGRRLDLQLMTDTCVVSRATGETTVDPDTGQVTPEVVEVFSGPCRLGSAPSPGREVESGEYQYLIESPRLHLPHDADVQSGDEAVITETETDNVSLGRRLVLVDLNRGTHRTSQRWNVEVVTR